MSSLLVVLFVVTHRSVSSTKPSPFREHVIRLREHVAVNPGAARESALKMTKCTNSQTAGALELPCIIP